MREEIKDWNTEGKFRDIDFRLPEVKNNPWFKFVRRNFEEAEDPSQRAPPLAEIFEDIPAETAKKSLYCTKISLVNAKVPMRCYLGGDEDGQ